MSSKKVCFGMGEGECESKVKVGSGKYQVCVGKVPQIPIMNWRTN